MIGSVSGIDEFEDFADSISNVRKRYDKAKEKAIEDTGNDLIKAVTQNMKKSKTDKGGTFHSETSPYTGGENESTDSTIHMRNETSWETEVYGPNTGAVFPNPEIKKRAIFMEYGTKDHGPTGDKPMYFFIDGTQVIMAHQTDSDSLDRPDQSEYVTAYQNFRDVAARTYSDTIGDDVELEEVSGVEEHAFFRKGIESVKNGKRFEKNMANRLEELFEDEGLELQGPSV